MASFNNLEEVLNYKSHRIITKRIEPYDVIESAKKFYDVKDFTFNGRNKFEIMYEFLNDLKKSSKTAPTMGLYMKNVNKFYLLTIKTNPNNLSDTTLLHKFLLEQEYNFTEQEEINQIGLIYSEDTDFALEQIDMGKAEASFILNI